MLHAIDSALLKRIKAALKDGADAMAASNRARARGDDSPVFFAPSRITEIRRAYEDTVKLNAAGDTEAVRRQLEGLDVVDEFDDWGGRGEDAAP